MPQPVWKSTPMPASLCAPSSTATIWRSLGPLVRDAHVRGDLRAYSDTDALLSLLLLIFPHLALAPYVRGMDPILGLDEPTPEQPALAVRRLVAVVADAFSAPPATGESAAQRPVMHAVTRRPGSDTAPRPNHQHDLRRSTP